MFTTFKMGKNKSDTARPSHSLHATHLRARIHASELRGDLEPNPNQNGGRREWLCASTFHNETKAVRLTFCNF